MKQSARPVHLAWSALTLILLMVTAKPAPAQGGSTPLAPGERAYGLTLAEWSAAWYQWVLSVPRTVSPNLDVANAGLRAGVGQHLPVWFGPYPPLTTGSGTLTLTIPAGAAFLIPAMASFVAFVPGQSTDAKLLAEMDAEAKELFDKLTVLEVSIDGAPIPDVKQYRVRSPLFNVILPPDNIFGAPVTAGTDPRLVAVAEGYWVLLPPLPVGKHVIVIRAEGTYRAVGAYKLALTVNLIVQEPNKPLP